MKLFAIESSFPQPNSVLRLLEPSDACAGTLHEQLLAGTYDKPFIIDCGRYRFLLFDLDVVQSAMDLGSPEELSLPYTRKMMTFLLFNPEPARILLLGLGGGSLAKFCYRRLPHTAVTVIEVNPDVITLLNEFHIPHDNDRFRVLCEDAARYVARLRRRKDVILADACDRAGIAPELDSAEFYRHVHRCLSPRGVLVSNLCGGAENSAAHLSNIRTAFDGKLVTLQVAPHGNIIVFAFKGPRPKITWDDLAEHAAELSLRYALDFPRYAQRLTLDRAVE